MRPFEGVKILDCTHVLAGPFAAYQLAVLGADVIKVEDPNEPDQSRETGSDISLNKMHMGTAFLTQGSNKRSIALNLKTEGGKGALKRLVKDWADVFIENYRPGAFKALGLGYEDLERINPKLIYASMTAFGQNGPRSMQTAYDHTIQAASGITASTGTEESGPIKVGPPVVDYATGTTGAFAIAAALFQRIQTGKGQHIDLAMLDVALILQSTNIVDHLHTGFKPRRAGNRMRFAEFSAFETSDGIVQLAAGNRRQYCRFYEAIEEPVEAKRDSFDERYARFEEKYTLISNKIKQKTAREWENYLQSKHVPAASVRELGEALQDPQLKNRGLLHSHNNIPSLGKGITVPIAAFRYAHGGPSLERPPARLGENTVEVLASIGYRPSEIDVLIETGCAL